MVLVLGYLVVPQLGGAGRALELLGSVNPLLAALAVGLQVASIACQAALTRSVLPPDTRPGFGTMARVELASTAVSHTVPGGTAAGTALGYRLLTNRGVGGSDAGFAVGARGLGSAMVLNILLWLALVISIPRHGFNPRYTLAAGLGVVLLGAFGAIVLMLMRHEKRARTILKRVVRPVPLLDEDRVPDVVARLAERLRDFADDLALVGRAVGWSVGYWLLAAASLWVFLAAFGHRADPVSLMVAFGLANVLAVIPITPRGLGVVEATLIPLLVGFGGASGVVTVGVLVWRLVNFWLPIPAGGLAYLSLRATRDEPEDEAEREPKDEDEKEKEDKEFKERLREEMEETYAKAERLGRWAADRGIGSRKARSSKTGDQRSE
ncbi:MAG: flippase-like domain-containing protein [Actinobacteria bacterium]|nr:flippase-like domain-containing protein [Actinomycetota bacterium]